MVVRKQALEEPEKIFIFNHFDMQGSKAIKLANNGSSLMGNAGIRSFPRGLAVRVAARR